MEILKGHTSPETAYIVNDYPYGFRLRCKIRYWIEYKKGKGYRFVSQTTNPKRDHVWNKPKASTYMLMGGVMTKGENGHIHWTALSEYCDGQEAANWRDKYGEGLPEAGLKELNMWVAGKLAYDANRTSGDDLSVGLKEAARAMVDEIKKQA